MPRKFNRKRVVSLANAAVTSEYPQAKEYSLIHTSCHVQK
jgi:hypothetical protein